MERRLEDEALDEIGRRLGAPPRCTCPWCGVSFWLHLPHTFRVLVFLDGEISEREEDQLDFFCSMECAERYAKKENQRCSTQREFDPHYVFVAEEDRASV